MQVAGPRQARGNKAITATRSSSTSVRRSGGESSHTSPMEEPPLVLPNKTEVRASVPNANGVLDKKTLFRRKHSVSANQLSTLEKLFPDFRFQFGKGAPHDHPLGATERAICETLALQEIERDHGDVAITDIGGNPVRHAQNGRINVHSCTPILSSDDVCRRLNPAIGDVNRCFNTASDCDVNVDVYLSVHSLYYLSQEQILDLVYRSNKGALYAVVHKFDNFYGTMHQNGDFVESRYEAYTEGDEVKIAMQVTGNLTSYSHDACLWLSDTYYRKNNRAIAWNGRKYGDSWILKFMVVPDNRIGNICVDRRFEMNLVGSLSRNDHSGPVTGILSHGDESKFKPMLQVMNLHNTKIHSFCGWLFLGKVSQRKVLLPKDLIQQVALKMVGCPRNKDGLKMCINTMRNLVKSDKMSMPNQMRLDCAIYGSAMAFMLTLEDEISAFNSVCSPYNMKLYSMLNGILGFEFFRPLFSCCNGIVDVPLTVDMYNRDRSSVPSGTFDAARSWPNGLPGYESNRPLKERRVGSKLSKTSREKIDDKPQFYAVSTTFSNYIPIVPYSSINNETVAAANRALMVVDKPDARAWSDVFKTAQQFIDQFSEIDSTNIDTHFVEWNSRFTRSRALLQAAAYNSLGPDPLESIDLVRKMFAKRELTMKGGFQVEDFDPRAIQGGSDRVNAAYGPFTFQVSLQFKKIFSVDSRIIYTGGMTAEEIGAIRSRYGDEDVTLIEGDESRYDAHQGGECTMLYNNVEAKCGIDDYGQAKKAASSMNYVKGYSSHGLKYEVDWTMTSGSPVTSTRNSFINGVKTKHILELVAFGDMLNCAGVLDYLIMVHGDDNIIIIRGIMSDHNKKKLRDAFVSFNKRLGFECKIKISHLWSEVEYCSSLFWPVEGGHVLGPKIGKRLPKFGFSLQKLKPGEVKGMLLGCNIECGYIPVLRTYTSHQLKLLTKVTKIDYLDKRSVYKALPQSKHKASQGTIEFFEARYGIAAPDAEAALKKVMTGNLTDCVDYTMLDLFTKRDL